MIVTWDNLSVIPQEDRTRISNLLKDLHTINTYIITKLMKGDSVVIDYQDWHDEYSPERVDPCPDYYGYYRLLFKESKETIGLEMKARGLDHAICILLDFIEYI